MFVSTLPPLPRTRPVRRFAVATAFAVALLLMLTPFGVAGAQDRSSTTTTTSTTTAAASSDDPVAGERLPTRGPVDDSTTAGEAEHLDLVDGLLRGVPIVAGDFADPYVLAEADSLYIYATNTDDAHVPVLRLRKGDDLTARYLGDALPKLPSWTIKGFQWAPAVWALDDGTFVMYYSTPHANTGFDNVMCISRATSDNPAGPFVDDSTEAFICPVEQGGAIDPSVFVDTDGTPYLLWKSDGNCCKLPTVIYSQQLSPDGLSVAGDPVELLTATESWEADLVEGPSMVRQGSTYFLFYSANNWNSTDYAIGAARCTSVAGPCSRPASTPWMGSAQHYEGPGGEEFFVSPERPGIWMVHHGWLPHEAGTPGGQRRLYLDKISFPTDESLPTRSNVQAVEEALLEDTAFLALLAGLGVGVVVVIGGVVAHRRRHS